MLGPATPFLSAGLGYPFCHPLPASVPGPLYIPPSNIPVFPIFCGQGCSHSKDAFPDLPQTETPYSSRALSTLTLESCFCVPSLLCLLHDPVWGFPAGYCCSLSMLDTAGSLHLQSPLLEPSDILMIRFLSLFQCLLLCPHMPHPCHPFS